MQELGDTRPVEGTRPALEDDIILGLRREFSRRAGDYALALALVVVSIEGGLVAGPRSGVGGAEAMARRSLAAEAVLSGRRPSEALLREAAAAAAAVDPVKDAQTKPHYRRELVGTMVYHALAAINPGWWCAAGTPWSLTVPAARASAGLQFPYFVSPERPAIRKAPST